VLLKVVLINGKQEADNTISRSPLKWGYCSVNFMSDSVYIHQKMLEDHTNTSKQECIQQQLLQETNISLPT